MKNLIHIFILLPLFSLAQVQFKSPEFEIGIRRHLNLNQTAVINLTSMDTIRKLDLSGLNIKDVNDVIFLKKIRNLDLSNNQIKDISPLLSLPHLQVLNVSNNNIKNIASFTFSDKRNFKLIVTGNEVSNFSYLTPSTFANVETVGTNRQKGAEPSYLLNDLFTTTRTNGQAKIHYNIWDSTNNCVPFTLTYGDSNTNSSLQCNSLTNNLDYDYTTAGFKVITITRANKTLISHFVAPYTFTYDMSQSYPIALNLPNEINLVSLVNTTTLGTATISGNQINYQPLAVGNDIIKVKYKYGTSNRTELFYIFTTNTNTLSINEIDLIKNLKIYPNPTDNILFIDTLDKQIQKIELFDLQGRLLKTINENKEKYQIDISNFSSSTYLIKLSTEKGSQTVKVVKK
jgi:Secretion system C-terminal sorting domain/Leucine Rich repeats (2 copies)